MTELIRVSLSSEQADSDRRFVLWLKRRQLFEDVPFRAAVNYRSSSSSESDCICNGTILSWESSLFVTCSTFT